MSNQNQPTYVNLTADGLAFMNRLRWAEPRDGDAYLALTLMAFHGKDGKRHQQFEAVPKGDTVCGLLHELMDQYPELCDDYQGEEKVTAVCGFTIAGLEGRKPFRTSKGKEVFPIGCNLIRIKWIKVNGEFWYREPRDEQQQGQQKTGGYAPKQHPNEYNGSYEPEYYDGQPEPAPASRQNQNGNRQAAPQRNGYQNGNGGNSGRNPNRGNGSGQRRQQGYRQPQY